MITRQNTSTQSPLFVLGLALGLISSLTGCSSFIDTCGDNIDQKEVEPNVVALPAVFSQSTDDALQLDDLEMEVVSEDRVVMTYFATDADGEDRLVEVQFEVTDIYQVFY